MALSGIGLKTNKSISRLDDVQTWHSFFGISVLCVLLFLTTRALDEDRWSDWGFGDAQTMLSLHQWEQEGWFSKNRIPGRNLLNLIKIQLLGSYSNV